MTLPMTVIMSSIYVQSIAVMRCSRPYGKAFKACPGITTKPPCWSQLIMGEVLRWKTGSTIARARPLPNRPLNCCPTRPRELPGSQYIWLAAIGKDIASGGVVKGTGKPATLAQGAATVLQLLGQQPSEYHSDIAPPMQSVLATTLQEPTQ